MPLAALLVMLLVSIGAGAASFHRQLASAQAVAKVASSDAQAALARSTADSALAASERQRADSLTAASRAAEHRAQVAQDSARVYRERYRAASASAPDTCRHLAASADSALAAQDSVAAQLRSALTSSQDALESTKSALDSTQADDARLRGALKRLDSATDNLIRHSEPGFFSRILPKATIGVGGGLNLATHQPGIYVGMQLGWPL